MGPEQFDGEHRLDYVKSFAHLAPISRPTLLSLNIEGNLNVTFSNLMHSGSRLEGVQEEDPTANAAQSSSPGKQNEASPGKKSLKVQ